ncbi:glucan endo-1,3-beta-glucosidase 7-like [Papaver somniferum]|uniref:glucan endo-1,3-beta-glucosidase 7-like n=1 Tax=Papaver somniferum TaxID=3469 RepID=UPI000E700B84|nr:glucan endo-1,3-beta-glucosidase 7-like [Papaver somniferum]
MDELRHSSLIFLILSLLFQSFFYANSESFIGINYGLVADNLPPPSETAKLLKSTSIGKVRLYGADPAIITSLANSDIGIVIGTSNADIPALATDPNFAKQWITTNVKPYYPASNIILITVGNEVFKSGDQNLISQLVPAMHNVQEALSSESLGGKIKVSTVHAMSVLANSEPPSAGSFDPAFGDTMKGLLGFLKDTGSPFMVNPYPFFAYQSDPRPETLAFCLFQPNSGRPDSGTQIAYMNMFDAQVDAVRSALNAMDSKDVEIVVAETGWAYKGDTDEVGATIENAKAYNANLIAHLRSMVGTPLMPGKSVDTYLFGLFDENLKPGKGSERAFGLFNPDLTMTYDVGLTMSSQSPKTPPTPPPTPPTRTPVLAPGTPYPTTFPRGGCGPQDSISLADGGCKGNNCSPPGSACVEPKTSHGQHMNDYTFPCIISSLVSFLLYFSSLHL